MAIPTMRKIQQHSDDVLCDSQGEKDEKGPPLGLRAGGGAHGKVSSMKRKKTSLRVLIFDMVAELAIAER
eukprot:4892360-Amphidinium_carterae.1